MAAASLPLPEVDSRILQEAFATAAASDREPNPTVRANLEAAALELWWRSGRGGSRSSSIGRIA
jgi:hypothetical protein